MDINNLKLSTEEVLIASQNLSPCFLLINVLKFQFSKDYSLKRGPNTCPSPHPAGEYGGTYHG